MRTNWHAITHMAQILAFLMAIVIAVAIAPAKLPASRVAASPGTVVQTGIPVATEGILATDKHDYPPAGAVRTVAQLTVPASAHWETRVSSGSLLLTVASGSLQVTIGDGNARMVHRAAPNTLHELAPGDSVVLFARDRLIMHDRGSLLTQNVSQDPVVAAVIRVI